MHSFITSVRKMGVACAIFIALGLLSVQPLHASADQSAYVRLIHASPDVGTVDVFVDGNKFLSSFQFATVTDYVPLPAGAHKVQVVLIGKGVDAAVITQMLSIAAGDAYTVAATGTKATQLSLTVFTDDNSVAGNGAKARIYHLSPGTGSASVTTETGTVASSLAYQQASDYITLPTGAHTFTVTLDPAHIMQPFSTTIKPWTVTSLFVVGLLDGSPALHFVSAQQQGMPGMPHTGADPTPLPQPSIRAQTPWLSILAALILTFVTIVLCWQRIMLRSRSA